MSRVISSLLLHHPDLSKIGPRHHKRNSVRRVEDMVINAIEKATSHVSSPAFDSRVAAATAMWRAGASEEEIREEHGKFVLEAVRLAVKGGKI